MKIHNRWYILVIVTLIYLMGYIDRQLVTILAPYIKMDLGISDTQIGLLYGTAFALFYGLFGLPLAKLADVSSRVWTLVVGLAFWSAMTAVSGMARGFATLGIARMGVGVGEASASPSAVSLIVHYFKPDQRGTAMCIYSTGVYIGSALSLIVGGGIVAWWAARYPTPDIAPFGMSGWHVAFILVGLAGIVLAAIVALTIPEPKRTINQSQEAAGLRGAAKAVFDEAKTMLPPWNLIAFAKAGNRRAITNNLLLLVSVVMAAAAATWICNSLPVAAARGVVVTVGGVAITVSAVQWTAIAIASYLSCSWIQSLRQRNSETFRLIIGSPAFMGNNLCGGLIGIAMFSTAAFNFIYAVRYLGFQPQAGIQLGFVSAILAAPGAILGGILSDRLKVRHPAGRLYMLMVIFTIFGVASALQYTSETSTMFFVYYGIATFFFASWGGITTATGQDVLPAHARGSGYAVQQLGCNLIGLGLGPFMVGLVSDATGSLRGALLVVLAVTVPLTNIVLWLMSKKVGPAEAAAASYVPGQRSVEGNVRGVSIPFGEGRPARG